MTEHIQTTVPAAVPPESLDSQMARMWRMMDGYTDANNQHHPGMVQMLTELYDDHKLRKDRRETFGRAVATGGFLTGLGLVGAWLKDHLKL